MSIHGCRHDRTENGSERSYKYCVADHSNDCNPGAHGGVTWIETCLDCDMIREHNANGRHSEKGHWKRVGKSSDPIYGNRQSIYPSRS